MAVAIENSSRRTLVRIDGEMSIFQAADLKAELLPLLDQDGPQEIEIDLSCVSEIDTAGIQLMLILKREAQKAEKTLVFVHHSSVVLAVIDILNLGSTLGDPLLLAA